MSEVSLQGISKTFGGGLAIDALDLHINDGEFFVLLGPSGCGKTTTLRCIAGLEEPDAGRITIGNDIVVHPEQRVFVPPNKRDIGMVFQSYALWPHMSVYGNVGYPLKMRGRKQRPQEVEEALALVGLTGYGDRYASALSGGQQQRVSLARALAQQPRLMLLDEPFSALDTGLRSAMRKMVARLLEVAGVTTILVTHDQGEALSFADQLAVMRGGRLVQSGHPMDLYRYPDDEQTAHFLGEAVVMPARIESGWAHCDLGPVPVNSNGFIGNAQIMLRPEQLQVADGVNDAQACNAVVTERDFAGNTCTLTVELRSPTTLDPGRSLLVRSSGMHAPPAGSAVQLSILGAAHVFAAS